MDGEEREMLIENIPHLREYLEEIKEKMDEPVFYSEVSRDLRKEKTPNIIYHAKGTVFIHIYKTESDSFPEYHVIEPVLNEREQKNYEKILERIYEKAIQKEGKIETDKQLKNAIKKYIDEITAGQISVIEKMDIEYNIIKEIIGGSLLDCFMGDSYIEDVHFIAGKDIHLIHKVFGMVKTNIHIDKEEAGRFSQEFSEKIGSPASEGNPIADGTLPDGSRVNIIHSKDISMDGPSMTIRKFSETPISITQLIDWGTFDAGIGAYLWLCLQYGRSLFVCGETASGKTTTTNAIIPFIPPGKKIYSVENTPEIIVPHGTWQQLLTRSTGPKEAFVDMNDLLIAGLRSRPDYIIPGEVRGEEGNVVFQAIQTGHPVITTFHAGSVTKVIQRFTGHPINVPKTFMDNLDVVLIQMAVDRKGEKLRRVLSLEEIEGYNKAVDGVMARKAFVWDPVSDTHSFKANRNSFILEKKIAEIAGFTDTMEVYEEYDRRKHILERMVEEKIFDYYQFVRSIWAYYREGAAGLPISI